MSASPISKAWQRVVVLSGGVGGARLCDGLAQVLVDSALTIIVNTGDDFEHWGLHIAPDLDTVMYTLAGVSDPLRGWGLRDETFAAHAAMGRLGAPTWFQLGDQDLATHLQRTEALRRGETLSTITLRMCRALGVTSTVLPMSDDACRTMITTREHGTLSFQDWFVAHRAQPEVTQVRFAGDANPTTQVMDALRAAQLVIIAPSNPYVSVDPILCLPGVREAIAKRPTIAVSPIVRGKAVKGPLAQMIRGLEGGMEPNAKAVAARYGTLLAGFVVEDGDLGSDDAYVRSASLRILGTQTVMHDSAARARLATEILRFAEGWL